MSLRYAPLKVPNRKAYIAALTKDGISKELAKQRYKELKQAERYTDDKYIICLYRDYVGEMNQGKPRTMMCVRLVSGEPFGNWNDLQEIKNQLLGAETELVQLFPAESRKVDRVNLYWFYGDGGERFEYGAFKRDAK